MPDDREHMVAGQYVDDINQPGRRLLVLRVEGEEALAKDLREDRVVRIKARTLGSEYSVAIERR